jgi:hypothetical protein
VLVNLVKYIAILITCLLIGIGAGGTAGGGLGWALSFGYERRGPNDMAHAPIYVTLALMYFGAMSGAVAGFLGGILICIKDCWKGKAVRDDWPASKLFS